MIGATLLLWSGLVLAVLLGVAWTVYLGNGLRVELRQRRHGTLSAARNLLAVGVSRGGLGAGEMARLLALSLGERTHVVADLAANLRGADRQWLGSTARSLGVVDYGVRLCRSRLWWRRLYGARILTLTGGGEDMMPALATDPHPLVRAQAAEWVGAYPSEEGISALISMLGDPARACRFTVEDALLRLGRDAVAPLASRLRTATDPVELRGGLRVARGIGDPQLLQPVLAAADSPDTAIRQAACRTLGSLGGADAAARLLRALRDDVPEIRAAAAMSLGEMGHWPAAPAVAGLLAQSDWEVRAAAGAALVRLGPPGQLLLRYALRSGDPLAVDMARFALETAAVVGAPGRRR